MFNLKGYSPKTHITTDLFVIRKLEASDVERDYETFISNVDAIKAQRGGSWPNGTETIEEDLLDLAWHQREFELGTSFAYQVISPDNSAMLGCVYFYPPKHPNNGAAQYESEGIDVSVNLWVTQEAFDAGLYDKLYTYTQEWLKEWPFKNPEITNLINHTLARYVVERLPDVPAGDGLVGVPVVVLGDFLHLVLIWYYT